jgi:hypothetical protein
MVTMSISNTLLLNIAYPVFEGFEGAKFCLRYVSEYSKEAIIAKP